MELLCGSNRGWSRRRLSPQIKKTARHWRKPVRKSTQKQDQKASRKPCRRTFCSDSITLEILCGKVGEGLAWQIKCGIMHPTDWPAPSCVCGGSPDLRSQRPGSARREKRGTAPRWLQGPVAIPAIATDPRSRSSVLHEKTCFFRRLTKSTNYDRRISACHHSKHRSTI